jgi:hypothetical protein
MVVQLAAVLAAPLYFSFYGDFVGVTAAMALAAGASVLPRASRGMVALPVVGAVCLVIGLTDPRFPPGTPALPDPARLATAAAEGRCVVSDSPRILIALDAVDRSLSPCCRNVVDIQGVGYGGGPDPRTMRIGLHASPEWKRAMTSYFRSGDVLALSDTNIAYFLGRQRVASLVRDRPATRSGGVTVYGPVRVR